MGNAIYATSALALAGAVAAGPASAADMLTMGIGGYMEQWVGMSSTDDFDKASNNKGGMAQRSDSEIYITGSLESDSGLKFAVKFELEGENGGADKDNVNQVDESRMTISGGFGEIWLGSDDVAATTMHAGHQDVGIGLNHGDVSGWIKGAGKGLGTAGTHADQRHIAYYTPRINGLHVGVSYVPDADSAQATSGAAPTGQENSGWSAGLNFKGDLGGSSVTFSLGHIQTERNADTVYMTTDETTAVTLADNSYRADDFDWVSEGDDATRAMMMKGDDKTFSNVGLQVGFGAFGFNVAYAAIDGGMYETMTYAEYTSATERPDDAPAMLSMSELAEGELGDASGGDYTVMQKVVKKKSEDRNVVSVGMVYSEGPMSVSVGHMINDRDDGTDSSASMLSASYTLAPGVAWKSSLFTADDNTEGKGHEVEGNGFVTGVKINF